MTRLQWIVLVLTLTSLALVIVFPPWLEVVETDAALEAHAHPYCCFDTPIWERPQPAHSGETITIDRRRLGWQLVLVALPGLGLFVAAGWLGRRRRRVVERGD